MIAASRSTPEWIASDKMETDPMSNPTAVFMAIKTVLDNTEKNAARDLRFADSKTTSHTNNKFRL